MRSGTRGARRAGPDDRGHPVGGGRAAAAATAGRALGGTGRLVEEALTELARSTSKSGAASYSPGSPAARACRHTRTSRRTSSASPTGRCRTGSPLPRSRRWPSSPTVSPSPVGQISALRGVNVDGVDATARAAGLHRGRRDTPRAPASPPSSARPTLLGATGPRLAGGAAGGRRFPPRPRRGGRPRERDALGPGPRHRGGQRRRLTRRVIRNTGASGDPKRAPAEGPRPRGLVRAAPPKT